MQIHLHIVLAWGWMYGDNLDHSVSLDAAAQ